MEQTISIQSAKAEDLDAIYQLMEYARKENAKNGYFCADDADYIREHITNPQNGFVLKATIEDNLAGFFMLHVPHEDENNMAVYKNLPRTEYDKVIHFDSLVVNPKNRGLHLMDVFLTKTEQILQDTPYKHWFATVHPDNCYSYNNLIKHGFEILTTTEKYGGLKRHVMYRMK